MTKKLCTWCYATLPKKPLVVGDESLCSTNCAQDMKENDYPSWMTGRVGAPPDREWHLTGDYLCLTAPNRYRQMFRKRGVLSEIQQSIVARQRLEFPWLPNPVGLSIDFPSWDMILIWEGSTVANALEGAPT